MTRYFDVMFEGNLVRIIGKYPLINAHIFMDQQYLGSVGGFIQMIHLNSNYLRNASSLTLQGTFYLHGRLFPFFESYFLDNSPQTIRMSMANDKITYEPGDILIASDNVNGLPPGYMGHTAIVVDNNHIVEVVGTKPIVRKTPISSFTTDHPRHALFRPKSAEMGKKAADYALNYLSVYKKANQTPNAKVPIFNFSLSTPLSDEWEYIYCSKLIWLSFYYGANYKFENDHLWFAPEDIYSNLIDNPDFEKIYIHPEFKFLIDI